MKTSFFTIYKIELIKLIKRKDWLAFLALVGISILFSTAIFTEGYLGAPNQSTVFWMNTQAWNSSALFISPLVAAFFASRIFASEIENGSILLYTNKYRNRGRLYTAKSLALSTFVTVTFVAMCLVNTAIYYLLSTSKSIYISGQFFGENVGMLLMGIIAIYLMSFLLASQFALFLGAYCKPTLSLGIVFLFVLVLHFSYRIPILNQLNPWYYVVRISNDISSTTEKVFVDTSKMAELFLSFLFLIAIYLIIFQFAGRRKFQNMDL